MTAQRAKKPLSVLIAVILIFGAVSGCSPKNNGNGIGATPEASAAGANNFNGATPTPELTVAAIATPAIGSDTQPMPLTNEELAYFNGDEFFNGTPINIKNQFLSSLYSAPEKIDLFELFYCGSGIDEKFTAEEKAAVAAEEGRTEEAPCACQKISRANMDAVLKKNMGITINDTDKKGLERFTYLEEYDSYYFYHGDTNYCCGI